MIIANTDYTDTLVKIESLKSIINDIQECIKNQIPQGITNNFDQKKDSFMNWIEETEVMLNQFKNAES